MERLIYFGMLAIFNFLASQELEKGDQKIAAFCAKTVSIVCLIIFIVDYIV